MSIHESYTRELAKELNYVATWLPTMRLEPGDICEIVKSALRLVGSLHLFDIQFEVEALPVETDMQYSSSGGVQLHSKLSGEVPLAGSALAVDEAGVTVTFSRSRATFLKLQKCTGRRLIHVHDIGEQVMHQHRVADWPKNYVVVTETVQAGLSTILISSGSSAMIDLVADVAVAPTAAVLASLTANFQVKRERDIGAKFVAMPGLTPLVRTAGVRRRWQGGEQFRNDSTDDNLIFASMGYDDYVA